VASGTSSPRASSAGWAERQPRAATAAARTALSRPRREALLRLVWRLEEPGVLAATFAVALVVRIAIAPRVGFYGDLRLFQGWAVRLREVGTHHFYTRGEFADYPPGYLYVLWLIGKLSAAPGYLLLKLPGMLADLGLAWVTGTFAARIAPPALARRVPVRALVATAILFNPAVIALSTVWGQVDALPALLALTTLLLLVTGTQTVRRELGAFLLFAVALAMKPQVAFVLPVLLYALYRRHLHARRGLALVDGAIAIGLIGTLSLSLWAVSGLPFGLDPAALLRFYRQSASVYPVTSANAFNLWGALGFWRSDSGGPLYVGTIAFVAALLVVLWRVHRALDRGADEARVLLAGSAAASLLAFTLLTRMHERYVFLALVCLGPLVVVRRLRLAYAALCGLFLLNLWYPYAYFNAEWKVQAFAVQPVFRLLLGGYTTDSVQRTVWSLVLTGVAIATARAGLAWAGAAGVAPAGGWRWLDRARDDAAAAAVLARSRLPAALVGLACIFGLVALRGQTVAAPNLNDSAFHMQMARWASGQIAEGRVPLDGWYPYLSLGSSFFHHYQSLPELLTAYAARVTGASVQTSYLWILYLLLALWPLAIYASARMLGWGRWTAAGAAAVAPLVASTPGYGFEHGSYTYGGYGVYSQLWAMWLLPLAWGLTWRAVVRGRRFAAAAAALALTVACHFITGYLGILTVGVWVILLGRGPGLWRRLMRALLVAGGAALVASWVLVPLIGDTTWTTRSSYYDGTYFADSFGARKVLGWLFTGGLFDSGRAPVVTALVLLGALVCAVRARADLRARALLGAFALSLLLFFGRPTLGPLLDLLPGFGDIQIHRFIAGVQLAGIFLAGVGLTWLLRTALRLAGRVAPPRSPVVAGVVAVTAAVALLTPAWIERARADSRDAGYIRVQQRADAVDGRALDRLVAIAKARGGGRVYAGLRGTWGRSYAVGYVPVYAWLADRDVDEVGFTFRTIASLSTDVEAAFVDTDPAQYRMLGIRYLLLPAGRTPPVPATLIARSGRHRLYELPDNGYFQVVDGAAAIAANRFDLEQATRSWRSSALPARGIYPGIAFAGGPAPAPTFTGTSPPPGAAGTVLSQRERLQNGVYAATVRANRDAVVLLSASYDPRWTVTVDGRPAAPVMMAPSLVGVDVPPGRHVVRFQYASYGGYPLLLVIGAVTLLVLAFGARARTWA
jgi:Gpi18-like mannosyltransferase